MTRLLRRFQARPDPGNADGRGAGFGRADTLLALAG